MQPPSVPSGNADTRRGSPGNGFSLVIAVVLSAQREPGGVLRESRLAVLSLHLESSPAAGPSGVARWVFGATLTIRPKRAEEVQRVQFLPRTRRGDGLHPEWVEESPGGG